MFLSCISITPIPFVKLQKLIIFQLGGYFDIMKTNTTWPFLRMKSDGDGLYDIHKVYLKKIPELLMFCDVEKT